MFLTYSKTTEIKIIESFRFRANKRRAKLKNCELYVTNFKINLKFDSLKKILTLLQKQVIGIMQIILIKVKNSFLKGGQCNQNENFATCRSASKTYDS
jgi:hypothetical protein